MAKSGIGFFETRRRARYNKSRQRIMTKGGRHSKQWFGGY